MTTNEQFIAIALVLTILLLVATLWDHQFSEPDDGSVQ